MKLPILKGENDWKYEEKVEKMQNYFFLISPPLTFKTWKIKVKKSELWQQIRVSRGQLPISQSPKALKILNWGEKLKINFRNFTLKIFERKTWKNSDETEK